MTKQQIFDEHKKRRRAFLVRVFRAGVLYPAILFVSYVFLMEKVMDPATLESGSEMDLASLKMIIIPSLILFGLILFEFVMAFKKYCCPKCEIAFLFRVFNVVVNNPKRCPECDVTLR